jgi:hypothetical protein
MRQHEKRSGPAIRRQSAVQQHVSRLLCSLRLHPPRLPALLATGQGEGGTPIDYLHERFWRGYTYTDLPRVNRDVQVWNRTVAMERIHGTTREHVRLRFDRG